MFTLNVRKLLRKNFGSWQSATPPRRKLRATFRPRLEVLEDRFCPATNDVWIATGTTAQSWDVGTNWSEGHSPNTSDIAVFSGSSGTSTACYIPAGANEPTIAGLTMGNYAGTLTLQSNLAANAVKINPRTSIQAGQSEIIINSGSNLYALLSLNWTGGNVSGSGNFEMAGTATINGNYAPDMPTLGTRMDVGTTFDNTYSSGSLTFSATSQPLVVVQNANIYINNKSTLLFNNQASAGKTSATAISNGDTSVHQIVVNTGGTLNRTNVCELFVATGLDLEGGSVNVSNPSGQTSGNPLHFTQQVSSGGPGVLVSSGSLSLQGDFTSDYDGSFPGGTVTVYPQATLTFGVNAASYACSLDGGTFVLEGTLYSHGGFTMYSGTFNTNGNTKSYVKMDTGNSFYLTGGTLYITPTGGSTGKLEIKGDFVAYGGTIVDNVNSSNSSYGVLQVDGAAQLFTETTFSCVDWNNPGPNKTFNWNLMTVGGTRTGDFYYNLPTLKWTTNWTGGTLTVQENT